MFRSTIGELDLGQLLQLLPVLEQHPVLEQNQLSPEVLNLDPDDPQFSWVFKNIDYNSWKSNDSPSVLCLSSHEVRQSSQVTSYIVGREEKLNRLTLYSNCSQIASNKYVKNQSILSKDITVANLLIYTLLKRTVYFLPTEERVRTMRNFFNCVLQKSFEKETTQHWIGHGFNSKNLLAVLQSLLSNAETKDLFNMLQITLDNAKRQYPLVVIEGIEKDYYGDQLLRPIEKFVIDLQRQTPNVKVLLVGLAACDLTGLSHGSLFITYDKERKGVLAAYTSL